MKKLSLFILLITIAASSFAQTNKMDITTVKKITTNEIVTSLKVYDNVEVILTDDAITGIQIVGEKAAVENTLVKISNGVLTITSSSEAFCKGNVVVYVPSTTLASITIHGSSTVSSSAVLSNQMLDVTINGEGRSAIKTAGNINISTIGDFPMEDASR